MLSQNLIYYQQLLQNINVDIIPDTGVTIADTGNRTLQLTSLQYNTHYNVSIGICGQPNQTLCS